MEISVEVMSEKRKLASIRRIDALNPIEGADKIEVATVGGWKVVCQKGQFKEQDLVVYFEIDSFLPEGNPAWQFLVDKSSKIFNGVNGHVLRTVKLRGQISQGLLLPFTASMAIKIGAGPSAKFSDYEGMDVTELLGIQKWEAPIPAHLSGEVRGNFPSLVPKTDEERIQSFTNTMLDELKSINSWIVTEKVDGSSWTVAIIGDDFHVCSRNLSLRETDKNTQWKIVRELDLERKMRELRTRIGNTDFAIQGELLGEGIQKNRYNIKGHKVLVFNCYNITDCSYFGVDALNEICDILGLEQVPVLDSCMDDPFYDGIEGLIKMAEGKSVLNPKTEREGLVFKSYAREKSFKVISNKFLMKGGE